MGLSFTPGGVTECVRAYAEIKVNQEKREGRGVRFGKLLQKSVNKKPCRKPRVP